MATSGPGGQPYGSYSYPANPHPHPHPPPQHHHQQHHQQHQQHQQHQPEMRFIPVSVSKSARSYFNIARKALETHRRVELSALEAAVVIAVDASFLLTRAKMGAVERVNTAFVQVPSHQPGHHGHLRKARIQIVLARTREFVLWGDSGQFDVAGWLTLTIYPPIRSTHT